MTHIPKHALRHSPLLGLIVVAAALTLLITSCTTQDAPPQPTSTPTASITPPPSPTSTQTPKPTPTPNLVPTPPPTPIACPAQTTPQPPTDREVLADLYEATDGPNWKNYANWLSDKPLEDWFGVTIDSDGRITEIRLGENGLSGEIPFELASLDGLVVLFLGGNALSGCLPSGILDVPESDVSALGLLVCGIAQQTQPTPDLDALVALYEGTDGPNWNNDTNWLSDKPLDEWHGVTTNDEGRVTELRLGENMLSGEIPLALANLPNLETLYLGGNSLSGCVPAALKNVPTGDVTALGLPLCERLDSAQATDRETLVAFYEATDGPNWTNNANWLSNRPLSEWHGVTTNAEGRVTQLSLDNNLLTGRIPAELGRLSNLESLNLNWNHLTGTIPPELANISNLQELRLSGNQITGEIPQELASLTNLARLGLSNNELTGEIPQELASLTNLARLGLSNNELTGEIPQELAVLARLRGLYLNNNQLTGKIPPELGCLASLKELFLYGNQLTGEIPPELGKLEMMESLILCANQLNGEIPKELRIL